MLLCGRSVWRSHTLSLRDKGEGSVSVWRHRLSPEACRLVTKRMLALLEEQEKVHFSDGVIKLV